MSIKKINKKDIGRLLSEWGRKFTVFVPSRESGVTKMVKWEEDKDASFLDWYRNADISAKANFLPPMEEMFNFRKDNGKYRIEVPASNGQKQLMFGIRPCDAKALAILDMIFKDSYEDPYYLSKRKNTVLVGLGCANPYDSCFCTSLGVSPTESTDVDIMLADVDGQFLMEGITAVGKELIDGAGGLEEATEGDETKAREAKETAYGKVTRKVDIEDIKNRLLSVLDDEEHWEKASAKCLSCGVCTFLCPTCYCFNINDESAKNEGARFRSWDSCAFPIYTRMPMENPRAEKWRRVQQKVYHKYQFYPMNFGVIACTGCGRCIRRCPVNWDITQTLERLPAKA
jgi:ferredoxin